MTTTADVANLGVTFADIEFIATCVALAGLGATLLILVTENAPPRLRLMLLAAAPLAAIPKLLLFAAPDTSMFLWSATSGTPQAYATYLGAQPKGSYAPLIASKLDEHDWNLAVAANTVRSYRTYQASTFARTRVEQARTAVALLQDDENVFLAAVKHGYAPDINEFLRNYSGHKRERDARLLLARLVGPFDLNAIPPHKVESITVAGDGIDKVSLRVIPKPGQAFSVRIPAGTYFVSANAAYQNMVVLKEAVIHTGELGTTVTLIAACANQARKIPTTRTTFTPAVSRADPELQRLVSFVEGRELPLGVRQAAVWIVTDNATSFSLVEGSGLASSNLMTSEVIAEAMRVVDQSGIDIRRKAVWRVRAMVLYTLRNQGLQDWITSVERQRK